MDKKELVRNDCLLFQEDKPILLPKHAIGFVEEIKKENHNEPNR